MLRFGQTTRDSPYRAAVFLFFYVRLSPFKSVLLPLSPRGLGAELGSGRCRAAAFRSQGGRNAARGRGVCQFASAEGVLVSQELFAGEDAGAPSIKMSKSGSALRGQQTSGTDRKHKTFCRPLYETQLDKTCPSEKVFHR